MFERPSLSWPISLLISSKSLSLDANNGWQVGAGTSPVVLAGLIKSKPCLIVAKAGWQVRALHLLSGMDLILNRCFPWTSALAAILGILILSGCSGQLEAGDLDMTAAGRMAPSSSLKRTAPSLHPKRTAPSPRPVPTAPSPLQS